MATVYSLICWGGYTGNTVSVSATTDRVTFTDHGVRDGIKLWPSGTLPSELNVLTPVYARSYDQNQFTLHPTKTDAQNNTNQIVFAGSSTYSAVVLKSDTVANPSTGLAFCGLSNLSRWYDSGLSAYRIFGKLKTCFTSRAASAKATDYEIIELCDDFFDMVNSSGYMSSNIGAGAQLITSYVNGFRSPAYHAGVLLGGYVLQRYSASSSSTTLVVNNANNTIEGFTVCATTASYGSSGVSLSQVSATALNMSVLATAVAGTGIIIGLPNAKALYCLSAGWTVGFSFSSYNAGLFMANCISTKNTIGMSGVTYQPTYLTAYNNIVVGNTTDWVSGVYGFTSIDNNFSASSGWTTGAYIGIATSNFASWGTSTLAVATDNFRPALVSSPQVDAGVEYYSAPISDIGGRETPAYNNGGAKVRDGGCFEFDLGYGNTPQSQSVTVSGVVSGSRIKIALQSDGTEIYNTTSPSWPQTTNYSNATPVYIYIRKGSAATYYHPLKLSATINPDIGLTYDTTGLQQADIAAHDYSATAVASDWTFNSGTGAITHASGSTRYNVQDLYSWHQDYYDDSATVSSLPLMHGTTSRIFELLNGGTITSTDLQALKGGSIEFGNGDLWSNLWTTDTMAAAHNVYVVQGTSKYTAFWGTGPIDVLLKVSDAGVLRSSGLVDVYARPYGYTYAYYQADLSGGGRNVAPIATLVDATCAAINPSGFTDVTYTFGSTSHDFGDVHGAQTYYCVIDCNNRPLSEVFARTMYDCRDVSTTMLNGVEGWRYQSAHAGYTANALAPFGMYSGGIWTVAKGVWLSNVPSGDLVNYILTDDAGNTHQNSVALNQSVTVSGLIVGSQVQIYDVTNATELVNQTASTSVVTWEDPSAPTGDREIRLRVGYLGKLFIDQIIGTCGTSSSTKDVSYLAAQQTDAVYVNNALDGSAMTNITVDATIPRIKVDESSGSKTWPMIYAYLRYYQTTAAGIDDANIDCISATDTANYFLDDANGWKIRSINAAPLSLTGGWARGSTAGTVASIIDAAGSTGNIYAEPDHVVAYQTTGTYAITGDISTVLAAIPSATDNTSAIFAQAAVTPMPGNLQQVLGTNIQTGSSSTASIGY